MKKLIAWFALTLFILSAAMPSLAAGTVTVTASGRVNVREGGSTDYPIITSVAPGSVFPCTGTAATGWYRIRLGNGVEGYISNKMTRLDGGFGTGAASGTVTIYYRTAEGRILNTETRAVRQGTTQVTPNAGFVPTGFRLKSAGQVSVTNSGGKVVPSAVLFIYDAGAGGQSGANVTVEYKDIYGSVVYTDYLSLPSGSHLVKADASLLPAGYVVVGTKEMMVSVSKHGAASPAQVGFLCVRSQTPTALPTSATVQVHYTTTTGAWLYTEYLTLAMGYNTVSANDSLIPQGYKLYSARSTSVYVNNRGVASPQSVTFQYRYEAPAPTQVTVPVFYRSSDGKTLGTSYAICREGSNTVYADDAMAPGYTLQGSRAVSVYVSSSGVASPAGVVFTYAQPISARVTVTYLDNAGGHLFSEQIAVGQGSHTIYANAARVPQGYVLTSPGTANVVVGADGSVSPAQVFFTYSPPAAYTPKPAPTPPPSAGGNYILPMHQKASISGDWPVYTGPGDWYYQTGANAHVSMGVCRWYGTEGGMAMMGYQYDTGKYRIGYIDKAGVPAGVVLPELQFMYEPVTVVSAASITDDPIISPVWLFKIPAGTTVRLLGFLPDNDHWAYIETDYTGQSMRGFINRVRIGR